MKVLSCDLLVIGAGSGGTAAALCAANLGASCIITNFVRPSPLGTTWGIGGTCVNVGCIPKKLMHICAANSDRLNSLQHFGWTSAPKIHTFDWSILQRNVTNHVHSLNFKINAALSNAGVHVLNCFASFMPNSDHEAFLDSCNTTITSVLCENDVTGEKLQVDARNVIIATGGRPKMPSIPGAEHGISSDDLFYLPKDPGQVLIVGGGYIALEFAGFIGRFAIAQGKKKPTLLIRSRALRGFDEAAVGIVLKNLSMSVDIFYDEPVMMEKTKKEPLAHIVVTTKHSRKLHANTVIFAVGRNPETSAIKLNNIGIDTESNGKIEVNSAGETSRKRVFAIGDIVKDSVELTPMAIYQGKQIANQLFQTDKKMNSFSTSFGAFSYDHQFVPTVVFTPVEYGRIGYTEHDACKKFGMENIKVYHTAVQPLEDAFLMQFPSVEQKHCYLKVVCRKEITFNTKKHIVIGWHLVCPNAGEITQSVGLAMLKDLSMEDIERVLAIHPTTAECIKSLQDKAEFPVADLPKC